MRAGRAQRDGAACPHGDLVRQGWRRGGELREGEGQKWRVERGGLVRLVEEGEDGEGSALRQDEQVGSTTSTGIASVEGAVYEDPWMIAGPQREDRGNVGGFWEGRIHYHLVGGCSGCRIKGAERLFLLVRKLFERSFVLSLQID